MDIWNYMAGGAAIGLIAGCWGKIKDISWKVFSLFIQRIEIETESAHDALVAHLITHYRRSPFYAPIYGSFREHHRDGRYGLVPYERFGYRSIVFWNNWFPVLFTNAVENKGGKKEGQEGGGEVNKIYSTLTFLRGTFSLDAILRTACADSNQLSWVVEGVQTKVKNRFVIHHVPKRGEQNNEQEENSNGLAWYQQNYYRLLSQQAEELGKAPLHKGRALDNLIFPQRIKNLINEIELWRSSREWYRDKGIPWKRGWLLYGPPGTGKTALARAFAEDLNMPIYVYNLAEMTNHELIRAWGAMQVNVPCIALIEDIDNVFHGRNNVVHKNSLFPMIAPRKKKDEDQDRTPYAPLTFDCLLNCLDGVERADGLYTIITTNDVSKVDPALGQPRLLPDGTTEFISTRPGRIDKAVELSYMEAADKKMMAERILGDYPDQYWEMLEFIDKFPDLQETPAQFQERCGQIALACFWEELKERQSFEPTRVADTPEKNSRVKVASCTCGEEVLAGR